MWKDYNDEIEELFLKLKTSQTFTAICTLCRKWSAHIYMHVYDGETRRGGLWIWCSMCHSFSHSSIFVPDYWENCSLVEIEKLSAIPIYLEEIKEKIDEHVQYIINTYF